MTERDAFFVVESGSRRRATDFTGGPWSATHQHGGPPAALLLREIECFVGETLAEFLVARVHVDFLRPVPIDVLDAEVTPERATRKVMRVSARLTHGGVEVARASVLLVRRFDPNVPTSTMHVARPMPDPEAATPLPLDFFPGVVGYHRAVEARLAEGNWAQGPAAAWLRALQPLIAGESISGMQRVLLLADAANGVAPLLPGKDWAFINPELSVQVFRDPTGAWIGLRAQSFGGAGGVGQIHAELHDVCGLLGHVTATLVVAPRRS